MRATAEDEGAMRPSRVLSSVPVLNTISRPSGVHAGWEFQGCPVCSRNGSPVGCKSFESGKRYRSLDPSAKTLENASVRPSGENAEAPSPKGFRRLDGV